MITPEEVHQKTEKLISTKENIRARQHQVHLLHLQGRTNQEISDKLGVSLSTVEKDLYEIRNQIKLWFVEYQSTGVYTAFRSSFEQFEQILKEFWIKYHAEKDAKTQIKILDSLADKITKFDMMTKENRVIERVRLV